STKSRASFHQTTGAGTSLPRGAPLGQQGPAGATEKKRPPGGGTRRPGVQRTCVEAGWLAGEALSGAPLSENSPGSGGRGDLQRPSPEQSHGRGIPREPSGETVRLAQEHPISASVSLIGQGLVMHAACQFFREKRYYCAKH